MQPRCVEMIGLLFAAFTWGFIVTDSPVPGDSWTNWRDNFHADGTPKPLHDSMDLTIWPNRLSRANSDPWIARNHNRIRQMRPRLLLLSFYNRPDDPNKAMADFRKLATAVEIGSKYHGYKDPSAEAFLDFEVFKFVDLGDPDGEKGKNSSAAPIKAHVAAPHVNADYGAFFSESFAKHIGVRDPRNPDRYLRLDELVDMGYVHEVWATAAADGVFRALECIELKPQYDEMLRIVPGKYVQSGNGGDPDQAWTGRSVRINILNYDRGIGCGMENLAHSFEGMAHGGAIPYFTKYFYEFASFNLDTKWGLPFNSFYPLWGEGKGISYPNPTTAVVTDGTQTWTIENYYAAGGNVHFLPNGRSHYDMANTEPVMSTIEDWRIGSGPNGADLKKPWTNDVLEPFREMAPDCMGRWLVYWRQNIPGFRNRARDDFGRPMKNWWVFLYY